MNDSASTTVYFVEQGQFDSISGKPWSYWVSDSVRSLFDSLPKLEHIAHIRQGLATADNFRFLRYWWEVSSNSITYDKSSSKERVIGEKKWFPCMKGGGSRKWYGNQEYIINWEQDGYELKAWADPLYGNSGWSRIIKSVDYYFREGITWSLISSTSPAFRWMKPGFVITHKGPGIYPNQPLDGLKVIGILNSQFAGSLLKTISPALGYEVGQVASLPWPETMKSETLLDCVKEAIILTFQFSCYDETTFDFTLPHSWSSGWKNHIQVLARLEKVEARLEDEVLKLYNISQEDQVENGAEFTEELIPESNDEVELSEPDSETNQNLDQRDLAVAWVSYAIGIMLGRFKPGNLESIGSAVFHKSKFALGSMGEPEDGLFYKLVNYPEHFGNIGADHAVHFFAPEVEVALNELAIRTGIAVMDSVHSHDVTARVNQALELMLGEQDALKVIQEGAGGDLQNFIEKMYFTQFHLKWYRKRPVYWYIQSPRRSYGFVIFHEKIDKNTFYKLQQEPYLATKRRAVHLRLEELQKQLFVAQGSARKKLEKEIAELRLLAEELAEFAQQLEAITSGGYEPEPDWIDDGIILRMAPLWPVIPQWKNEPKKYWERLEKGDFDWSHIAMKYWPDRVREKCKTNKSYAIAHGHEEWYQGK